MRGTSLVLAAAVTALSLGSVGAADTPMDLKWAQMMPPLESKPKPKTFFSGATPADEMQTAVPGGEHPVGNGDIQPPAPLGDGAFMSMKRRQPGGDKPPRVVAELNGKRVRIGGYVVPLDFESTKIKEFLLVPFVGACIHVPPPPANQIVYVKVDEGFEVAGQFDPVWVTGTMKTETAFTGLADAGYTIDAESVDPRPE
jgi:hypothetical protein